MLPAPKFAPGFRSFGPGPEEVSPTVVPSDDEAEASANRSAPAGNQSRRVIRKQQLKQAFRGTV